MQRLIVFSFFLLALAVYAQEQSGGVHRGSIPEELIRPRRGEEPRYPIDTVIGGLGRGDAPAEAFEFANRTAAGFLSRDNSHPGLSTVGMDLREDYIAVLSAIEPVSYRLGGGRHEPDGAVSFLVRFMGREYGITGELFIRYITVRSETLPPEEELQPGDEDPQPSDRSDDKSDDSEGLQSDDGLQSSDAEDLHSGNGLQSSNEEDLQSGGDDKSAGENGPGAASDFVAGNWVFEDLILEEARTRESEHNESLQRFDFSPYERLF